MTGRTIPNEAECPIPLDLLARLLRSDEHCVEEIILDLSAHQRASLAAFCYNRCHLRDLSFRIAARCDQRSLVLAAGTVGVVLYSQSRESDGFGRESQPRRKISLARSA